MNKVKKIAKWVAIAIGLLVVLIVTLPFVIDVNRFKDPILKKVEAQINGRVTLDKVGLKLFPFIGLRLENLAVQNLPETPFGDTPLLKLGEMDFRIHLKSILQRKIVASLLLRGPEIQFIKRVEGSNVDLLIKKPTEAPPPPPVEETKEKPTKPSLIQEAVVERISIKEGLLVYDDQTPPAAGAAPKAPMKISGLRLEVTNAVLTDTSKPIGIDLGLHLFDAKEENVAFKANVSVDQKTKIALLEKASLTLAGSTILIDAKVEDYETKKQVDLKIAAPAFAMNSIYGLMPELKKSLPPESSLEGSLALNVAAQGTPESMNVDLGLDLKPAAIRYGESFVKSSGTPMNFNLKALYRPANPEVSGSLSLASFRSTQFTLTNVKSAFSYGGKIAQLNELGFDLFEGHFSGAGVVNLTSPKLAWDFTLQIENLNMDVALTQVATLPNVLTGRGNLDLKIQGVGTTAEEIKKTLSGNSKFSLREGELKALNLAPAIFSEKIVGALSQVTSSAPPALQGTVFQTLAGSFTIQEGKLIFPDTTFATGSDQVQLGGTISLEQKLDLTGKYFLSKGTTEAWITNAKIRPHLTDKEGRFLVPFVITGELKSPLILPDVAYVGNLAAKALAGYAKEEVKQKATEQLQKAAPQVEEQVKEKADEGIKKLKKLF